VAELIVDIVTPERLVFSGRANELRAPGWNGEFDVLPGHQLYLSLLHGGVLTLVTEGGEQRFAIGRGFAEAGPDRVTILTEHCVAPADVDRAASERELATALEDLLGLNGFDDKALAVVEERIERARAELAL